MGRWPEEGLRCKDKPSSPGVNGTGVRRVFHRLKRLMINIKKVRKGMKP